MTMDKELGKERVVCSTLIILRYNHLRAKDTILNYLGAGLRLNYTKNLL